MQTFLPYPSFEASAKCLDRQRLGKQRVEAWQIMEALRIGGAWANHPATKMWQGHLHCLAAYGVAVCEEWLTRGYKDTMLPRFEAFLCLRSTISPPWLGHPDFHASHRSNLLRKSPKWYGKLCWTEPPTLPYIWPKGDQAHG